MFKRIIATMLVFVTLIGLMPMLPVNNMTAEAATINSGTCGENLTWVLDDEATLTISGTGDMDDFDYDDAGPWTYISEIGINNVVIEQGVTSIGDRAFMWCDSLTNITIPNSVVSIGDGAFAWCSELTNIAIPDSVASIGDGVFEECDSLTSINIDSDNLSYSSVDGVLYNKEKNVLILCPNRKNGIFTIPDSVTGIGDGAFCGCYALSGITIPDSVTDIGKEAFIWCYSLNSITIPDSVTSIGDGAFYGCYSLTNINIPDSVTSIGNNTFVGCNSLKSISIPSSVKTIGDSAFDGCTSLTSIAIPNGVTSIGDSAFMDCGFKTVTIPESVTNIGAQAFGKGDESVLESISVDKKNTKYCSVDGILFSKDKKTIVCYPVGKSGTYAIPNYVENIADGAFFGCDALTEITIPDSVTYIGEMAFWGCDGLTSLEVPGSVKNIGACAFYLCSGLLDIKLNYGVETIGDHAFDFCENEFSITIPSSLNKIGDYAFYITYIQEINFMGSEEEWAAVEIGRANYFDEAIIYFHEHSYNSENICAVCGYPNKITVSVLNGISVTNNNASFAVGTTAVKPNNVTLSVTENSDSNTLISALGSNAKKNNKGYEIALTDSKGSKVTITGGSIAITLPFPDGVTASNYKDYVFALYHFTSNSKYEEVDIKVNSNGMTFTTSRFSPFLLTYEKKASTTTTPTKPTSNTYTRLAGTNRCETAVEISKASYNKATNVVIASGDDYADALAGVPLAYALDAPILLIRNHTLDDATLGEIKRLGAKNVYILGGEFAINAKVAKSLTDKGYKVTRLAGSDRFGTSLEIAKKLQSVAGKPSEIIFVYSHNYPDALAVSGVAAAKNCPVIYIAGTGKLTDGIASFVKSSGAKKATIISGPAIVNGAAEGNIKKAGASTVNRIYGVNRYETCIKINEAYASVLTGKAICVATGTNYPDALAGGVFAAINKAPLVLVDKSLTDSQRKYIKDRNADDVYAFGGTSVVSDKLAKEIAKL